MLKINYCPCCEEIKLFFRYNPGIGKTNSETLSNVLGGPNAKFGMDSDSIIDGIKKSYLLGTKEFGIHVMTGSNVTDINYWSELIDKIFELLDFIKKSGFDINFINLGGGIGIDYKTGEKHNKHKAQLEEYELALQEMNFTVAKKALIYIGESIEIVTL